MRDPRRLIRRLRGKWRRFAIRRWARRDFALDSDVAYISFTFDDFPRSALAHGGRILVRQGVRGTFFVSWGLLGRLGVSGRIASRADLLALHRQGHELGCHTFDHLDGTRSSVAAFRRSIAANRAALVETVPDLQFRVFAYPLEGPGLSTKREAGRHFVGCRGGGQSFNAGVVDLNFLNAFFIDSKSRDDFDLIRTLVRETCANRGWLIFATHDVTDAPSPYGCTPECFERIVRLACGSAARVLPMAEVCHELRIPPVHGSPDD